MLGLYLIAFLAPLLVFGPFAYVIRRADETGNTMFGDKRRAMTLFVIVPLGICYGLIVLSAGIIFVRYILSL